jgi:hypothetical protein
VGRARDGALLSIPGRFGPKRERERQMRHNKKKKKTKKKKKKKTKKKKSDGRVLNFSV